MALRLIHWNGPEGRERQLRLASFGHPVDFDDVGGPALLRLLRAQPPDGVIIDLSRLPSHGREIAMWLRTTRATRHVPLIFVDGEAAKVARLKALLPDATYTTWGRLKTALPRALSRPLRDPVMPPTSHYSGKPTIEKLGIKPGMRVAVLRAPRGVIDALGPPPKGVVWTARASADCDLFLAFSATARELAAHLQAVAPLAARQTLWLMWPKKAAKTASDLDGNLVRITALAAGWVDYKVCAVDATWSGLACKRRPLPTVSP